MNYYTFNTDCISILDFSSSQFIINHTLYKHLLKYDMVGEYGIIFLDTKIYYKCR